MKKLLLVTYHFPPDAEIGSIRPYQMARHLPDFGFEPWVLTVEPPFAESPDPAFHPDDIPANRLVRTPVDPTIRDRFLGLWRAANSPAEEDSAGSNPNLTLSSKATPALIPRAFRRWALKWLAFPDPRYGWRRHAALAGKRLCTAERFDVILSTSPPRVAHFVAAHLARRHAVPWVMDLRDPWSATREPAGHMSAFSSVQSFLFKQHAAQAAQITTNTEALRHEVAQFLGPSAPPITCVPNGYDPSVVSRAPADARVDRFAIGHFGQLSGRRSARSFLCGLRLWFDRRPGASEATQVRFVGSGFEEARRSAESLDLGCVSFQARVPRELVPALLADQFALLLLANDQPLQVPGKTYEYLAASRRILALTERSSATAAVVSAAAGAIVAGTPEEVATALDAWWSEFLAGEGPRVDRTQLLETMTYARRTEEMAALLAQIGHRRSSR